uniref:Uncharacterized protein n=1 Tax=Acrobeloides nanus TaxID=290746 RepID=A0A914CW75_9BILA
MVSSTISSSADLSTSTHHPLRPKQPPPKIPPKPSHLTKPRRTNLAGNNKPIDLMNHQCASIYVSSIKSRDEPSECIASTSETNNVVTVEICDTTTSSVNTGMIKPEVSPKPMPWPRTRPKSISRKPTMKPPPPPVSSAIATLSGKPVHNTITASNSSSNYTSDHNASCNIYQSLSSPESPPPNNLTSTVPVQKSTFVRKGSGFYGKDRRSTPSIPKIPPPSPPKCPMVHSYNDDERFDELYEDIEHSIIMDDEPEAPIQKLPKKGLSSLFYSPKFTKKSEKKWHLVRVTWHLVRVAWLLVRVFAYLLTFHVAYTMF